MSPLSPGEEGARETKPERFTNLRAKWDGNGKRDWKGGRVAVVRKGGGG